MPVSNIYDSRSSILTDPIRNFKFQVTLHGLTGTDHDNTSVRMGFMSVSGLGMAVEPIPYREGGDNTTPRKLAGQANFSDVTLSKGVVLGSYRHWYQMRRLFHAINGEGLAFPGGDYRFKAVDIAVLDHPVNAGPKTPRKMEFRLHNAWIASLTYGDLDAGGNSVFVEQLTLTHEGFDIKWATALNEDVGFPA